jgi:twinkle protein
MSSLTSIDGVMRKLDGVRQGRLRTETVDFDAYLKQHEEDIGRIKTSTDFRHEVKDEFFGDQCLKGATLPWPKTHDLFRMAPGEVTIWTGYNGHMKSMLSGYVMLDLLARQNHKVCIASFEMKPRKTLRRMASQAIGSKHPSEVYVDKFLDAVAGKVYLYDQQGETTPERILGVIHYCAKELGVTHFVIDSLMKVIGDEDDYNGQKKFVGRLCSAARDLNIHIHLVHHSRKREDEATRPTKQDSKGSGAIVDQADNFVVVFKRPADEKKEIDDKGNPINTHTHTLSIDKSRNGEWEGNINIWFNPECLQFNEYHTTHREIYVR